MVFLWLYFNVLSMYFHKSLQGPCIMRMLELLITTRHVCTSRVVNNLEVSPQSGEQGVSLLERGSLHNKK